MPEPAVWRSAGWMLLLVSWEAAGVSTARIPDGTPLGLVQAGRGRTHGQRSTYVAGCRCTDCTDANSDFQAARQRLGRVPPGGSHGLSGYNSYGCRCQVCRLAKSESNARRYAESVRAKALAELSERLTPRPDPPVKPTSEVAHQPGQQPEPSHGR